MDDILNKEKIKVCLIGAGKIAHSIIPALLKCGYNVDLIISQKIESAKLLSHKYNISSFANSFDSINDSHNLFILSVPDGAIKSVANKLADLNINFEGKFYIHLSGTKNISELISLKEKGAFTGSLHIMHTFPEREEVSIKNFPAAIEAESEQMFRLLKNIANDFGLNSFNINPDAKTYYHLMGVFASNFLTANIFNAELCKDKIGEESPSTFDLVGAIVSQTLKNIKTNGVESSLSGPIARGDLETVKEHIHKLKESHKGSESGNILLLTYISQSLTIVKMLERNKDKMPDNLSAIKSILLSEFASVFG